MKISRGAYVCTVLTRRLLLQVQSSFASLLYPLFLSQVLLSVSQSTVSSAPSSVFSLALRLNSIRTSQ